MGFSIKEQSVALLGVTQEFFRPKHEFTESRASLLRGKVRILCESKIGQFTVPKIVESLAGKALEQKMIQHAIGFDWEAVLVGSHLCNFANNHKRHPLSSQLKHLGLKIMDKFVTHSRQILDNSSEVNQTTELNLEQCRIGRFEGDLLAQRGEYADAYAKFNESAQLFASNADASIRYNALEQNGFAAEMLIRGGKARAGFFRGMENFHNFSNSIEGMNLRDNPETLSTWENWRAGCIAKLFSALIDSGELDSLNVMTQKPSLTQAFNEVKNYANLLPIRRDQLESLHQQLLDLGYH